MSKNSCTVNSCPNYQIPQQYRSCGNPPEIPTQRLDAPSNGINSTNYDSNVSTYSNGGSFSTNQSYKGGGDSNIRSMIDGLNRPTPKEPTGDAETDEKNSLKYQMEIQAYNRMMNTLTNIIQIEHDTKKAVIQNFRV